jgi:hypothetical protein
MRPAPDPIRRLPRPAHVREHIGHLLRELRVARRLLRLSQAAESLEAAQTQPAERQGVARG